MLRGAAWAVPPLFFAEKETVMKSFTMFGSHVCPDTIAAMCILDKKGLSYTYKDITGTMIFLKEFLHLRDSRRLSGRQGGRICRHSLFSF